MPHKALTHDENRAKVCAVCYCKSGSKATRKVSDQHEAAIKDLVFEGYNKNDSKFPSGLCDTCHFSLLDNVAGYSLKNKKSPPRLLILPDTETYEIQLQRVTRGNSASSCQCIICDVARLNGIQWKQFVSECRKSSTASTF